MVKYILEFSNESKTAVDEVLYSATDVNPDFRILSREGNVANVDADLQSISEMSFLNYATRVLTEFEDARKMKIPEIPEGSFYVRKKDYTGQDSLSEAELGDILKGNREISFRDPAFIVRAVKTDHWYLGIMEFQKDSKGMNQRRAPLRPFFSPVTIHPRYARFLVNISRTRPGDAILDPFCGTGGILIEAHLLGRIVFGSDASLAMVKGARLNMKYFGISAKVEHRDFSETDAENKVKAVITDLPYGKNSELSNYDLEELYTKIFPKFHSILDEEGTLALVLSDPVLLKYADGYFKILSSTPFKQHRSLTRHFVALRKN